MIVIESPTVGDSSSVFYDKEQIEYGGSWASLQRRRNIESRYVWSQIIQTPTVGVAYHFEIMLKSPS